MRVGEEEQVGGIARVKVSVAYVRKIVVRDVSRRARERVKV